MPRNVKKRTCQFRLNEPGTFARIGIFVVIGRYHSRRFGSIDSSEGTLSG